MSKFWQGVTIGLCAAAAVWFIAHVFTSKEPQPFKPMQTTKTSDTIGGGYVSKEMT